MVFTLVRAAAKTWRKLNGTNQLPRVIQGVKFTDVSPSAMPPKTAPPDQPASPKLSHSSAGGLSLCQRNGRAPCNGRSSLPD